MQEEFSLQNKIRRKESKNDSDSKVLMSNYSALMIIEGDKKI